MKRTDVISYLHKFIKKANEEQLRSLICSTYGPRCSSECPLRNKISSECKKIDMEESKNDL